MTKTISITIKYAPLSYQISGNKKRSEQSMKADHELVDTAILIIICGKTGDKQQLKTLFLTILDLRSSIVLTFLITACPVCLLNIMNTPKPK